MKLRLIAAFAATMMTAPALAQIAEVTCKEPDCLTLGSQNFDANGDAFSEILCNGNDCDVSGWLEFTVAGNFNEVKCSNDSCYGVGFQETDLITLEPIRTRVCSDGGTGVSDCLTHGWTDEYTGANARIERVTPVNGNSVQDGFLIQEVEDRTAALEQEIEDLRALKRHKRSDYKAFRKAFRAGELETTKQEFKAERKQRIADIVATRKLLRQKRRELRKGGGETIVSEQIAICKDASGTTVAADQNPGSCFIEGYVIQ